MTDNPHPTPPTTDHDATRPAPRTFAGQNLAEADLARADLTDEDGGARLRLDPALEPTAQPRTYVVEATVVDVDEQTVSATRQVVALPPLLLGLRRRGEPADRILGEAGKDSACAAQGIPAISSVDTVTPD